MQILCNLSRTTGACILFTMGLFVAGLWPFNFRADNQAMLMPEGKGLRFDAPLRRSQLNLGGIAFTPEALACRPQAACEAGVLTIHIELVAESEASSCIKRILDIRRPDGSAAIYLGQWKTSLILRWSDQALEKSKFYREIGVEGGLATGQACTLTIVSGPLDTTIFIDGRLRKSYPGLRLLRENESLGGHKLYFGNSPDLNCPWAGSIRAFALFETAWAPGEAPAAREAPTDRRWPCGSAASAALAAYRFERLEGELIPDASGSGNHLRIPGRLVFEKQLLGLPADRYFSIFDFISNLIGFIPLGFMVYRRGSFGSRLPAAKYLFILSVAVGFGVSLAIESIQTWLPGRDSSALDLILNTAGTAIGAFGASRAKLVCHEA